MFHVLLESGARTPRRTGWTLGSTAMHAGIVTAVAVLTLREPPAAEPVAETVRIANPWCCEPKPAGPVRTGLPAPTPFAPVVVPPDLIPIGIPAEPTLSFAPTEPLGPGILHTAFRPPELVGTDQVFPAHEVEQTVVPLRSNPSPEYPDALRRAMVEGGVLVQFVVDSTGRVEPQSISTSRSSHPLFDASVRRWLVRTRYEPAEIRGQRVRQLVQQEIAFSLDR